MIETTPRGVPAGWHRDPLDAGMLRWWDGTVWTEHVSAMPGSPVAPETRVRTERPAAPEKTAAPDTTPAPRATSAQKTAGADDTRPGALFSAVASTPGARVTRHGWTRDPEPHTRTPAPTWLGYGDRLAAAGGSTTASANSANSANATTPSAPTTAPPRMPSRAGSTASPTSGASGWAASWEPDARPAARSWVTSPSTLSAWTLSLWPWLMVAAIHAASIWVTGAPEGRGPLVALGLLLAAFATAPLLTVADHRTLGDRGLGGMAGAGWGLLGPWLYLVLRTIRLARTGVPDAAPLASLLLHTVIAFWIGDQVIALIVTSLPGR